MLEELLTPSVKKIGVTERGDPSLNYTWLKNISKVDCAVIISKRINERLANNLLFFKNKVVFHHTITGYGSSVIEPNIYSPDDAFSSLKNLVNNGFPKNQIVIRVDPIIPTKEYFEKSLAVIDTAIEEGYSRIRFSFIDMYKHVKERFSKANIHLDAFDIDYCLEEIKKRDKDATFESCCEKVSQYNIGCVSEKDISILGFKNNIKIGSFKQRPLCMCLPKVELISVDEKQQCPYKCIYCYWKDKKENNEC